MLKKLTPKEIPDIRRNPVDAETLQRASEIMEQVQREGEPALRRLAKEFGDIEQDAAHIVSRAQLEEALMHISEQDRGVLERTAMRIKTFACAQRDAIVDIRMAIPGGYAGHTIAPVEIAGCYAPGGRFPLPSSVLMTSITARAAGCSTVWVASPKPTQITLAAAALGGADALLAVGGAQAIAAFAYGAGDIPACDAIVGPGNRWVTAAKQLVAGRVRIDMLAGPSELVVLADEHADAKTVAADLLAQAEHDPDALPVLVTPSHALALSVDKELVRQLNMLPTADTARPAMAQGFTVLVADIDEGIVVCNKLAPEHLEVLCKDASSYAPRLEHYGGLFLGEGTAEVLGDYGAGPNHTLPTGGTARSFAGLSVFNFLRARTWMHIDDEVKSQTLVKDAVALARMEGLEGHARSAIRRQHVQKRDISDQTDNQTDT